MKTSNKSLIKTFKAFLQRIYRAYVFNRASGYEARADALLKKGVYAEAFRLRLKSEGLYDKANDLRRLHGC